MAEAICWKAVASGGCRPGRTNALTPKEDSEEPPLYQVGDWVWVVNYRRRRRQAAKSQPKLVGPYAVVEVMPNRSYKLERSGQVSIQNEARLKPYWASLDAAGEAPPLLEPRRQTTTLGRRQHGPEYEVVVSRAEDLVGEERPLPSTETDPEVQNPRGRGSIRRYQRGNTSH